MFDKCDIQLSFIVCESNEWNWCNYNQRETKFQFSISGKNLQHNNGLVFLNEVVKNTIISSLLSRKRNYHGYKWSTDDIEPTDINFGDVRNISRQGDSDPQACKGKIRHGVPSL